MGWFRAGEECRECGQNSAAFLAFGAFVMVIFAMVGFRLSAMLSTSTMAMLRNVITSIQYLSASLEVDVRWLDVLLDLRV